jgi:hypothetical protein
MHDVLIGLGVVFALGVLFGVAKTMYWRGGNRRR